MILSREPFKSNERYRHEWKYLINWGEKEMMTSRMAPILKRDENAINGIYMIRSLYFDDYWSSAYDEKDAGVLERKKYRIRIYNYQDKVIKLERKKKYDSYIFKESAGITRDEFEKILAGDYEFLLQSPKSLLREFYIECVCNGLRPRTIVDYEREPWIMDTGTVRITFDMNVRAAVGSFDIFDSELPCLSVIDPGKLVLEVKYTELLPKIVQDILPPEAAEFVAVSKYVLCYEKTQYLNENCYWMEDGHEMPSLSTPYAPKYKTGDYIFKPDGGVLV